MTTQSSIPLKWYVPFANGDASRVELPVTTADPTRASQTLGFPPLTMQPPESGGAPPQGEDFNGGMNQVARIAWWVLNGGGWPYDSTFATNSNINGYPNGAKLQAADFRGDWINTADNNQNNPDTNGTSWVPGFQYGTTALTGLTGGTVTPTPAQAAKNAITLAGTLTSALTIILPTWLKNWTFTNNTTGAFVVIVKTLAGSGVTIPQNSSSTRISGDGTNIVQNPENIAPAVQTTNALQLGQATGRLLRTTTYINVAGALQASIDGGAYATISSTFTPQTLTSSVDIEIQGGGAQGGGAPATGAGQVSVGSGGGGGGYTRARLASGFSGLTVTVGIGGSTGGNGANGQAGGSSSFGPSLSATGGNSGVATGPFTANTQPTGAAAGGVGTGGYIIARGGVGFYGLLSTVPIGGQGGSSMFGSGGTLVSGTFTGNAAESYGSGGSGSALAASNGAVAGGAGKTGVVIVREYS